ncbi:tol-pal system-associated acyl-CoA thioesterase [Otariodibacter oris]|uniref:Acyl-CoA thioester hydrolase n=1 Tax=Otariodibacter oris TaxID=1032623 RepID=A0A420XHS3_9PAST|nr:tol-pal system-associated acyl-CoA thioesterase [Otariodibacter oris]QGM81287.1 tol-pal system-associated acyl-CoA thioesterase [Otariodibacter oris]RKR72851.1 acyl-CoA thioester hydrolase [Otariodibacter oris]
MQFPIRVYYEDTDAGGVVYHAQYLNFFERARTELLRTLSFSQQRLLSKKIAFVVKKIEIDYKLAAHLDDMLIVETEIVKLKKASIIFRQKLWRDEECLNEATVVVACVNLEKMKPIVIPDVILIQLQAVGSF